MRITFGFFRFARENNLSDGVMYEFELIKRKPHVVLQVTASHTVKCCFTFVYASVLFLTLFSPNVLTVILYSYRSFGWLVGFLVTIIEQYGLSVVSNKGSE